MATPETLNEHQPATALSEHHRLLIVDDDLAVRMVSRLALSKAGFGVTEASDGYTALSWLDSHKFDAILLDARMPGMDGFETCRKMRDQLNGDTVPIIMVTGQDDDESIDAAFECGATDFVAKPLNWRIICQRLNSLIGAGVVKKHLKSRSHQISSMLKTSSETMLLLDGAGVIQGTHQIERLPIGFRAQMTVGNNFFEILDEESVQLVSTAWATSQRTEECESFIVDYRQDEKQHTVQGRFVPGAEGEWLCLLQDQSALFSCEQQAFELEFKDAATGIANEKQLLSELGSRLRECRDTNTHTAIIRFSATDLRSFEATIGRGGMVKLAQAIVERLEIGLESYLTRLQAETLRPSHLIARLCDSDYVVVLSGLDSFEFIEELATLLLRRLSTSIDLDEHICGIDWTAGIADTLDAPPTTDGLLSATAYAIYSDCALPNGYRVHRYNSDLKARVHHDIEIERLLRRDIADGVLEMHYQPKFDLSDLSLIGMEALIRWNNAELGFISPAKFIPIAEKSGLIISLSHLVVEKVLDQIAAWRDEGYKSVPTSINISGIHLNTRTIVEELRAGIQQRRIPPELVELEVTESIMVDGVGKAFKNLNELRDMGIRVAIDDFGTGYSSLSYLKDLPADCLKIDRSFVQSITSDPTAEAIARAIITVGHDVNMHVIAEGVETAEELNKLAELGCDSVQGYFTGRPVSSCEFTSFFEGARLAG
ncbi:EAL domain-containing protein [Marinobacter alexandrii]|uniref:two-component system response regulator n=1 Tax=Marinobacter alexandrii TaxID=2570351 RepID=UPI001FFFFDD2|nr:EAL domain-containing protein [Marinobacter alexandrii]MCK2147583.1 EAL domain-containing protein [Marinobacter alexandrii]